MKLCLLLNLVAYCCFAQIQFTVVDAQSNLGLEKVEVLSNAKLIGYTNAEGTFNLEEGPNNIRFSKKGYYDATWNKGDDTTIALNTKEVKLSEFVISSQDTKARDLVRKVIKNYKKNTPENLESYTYKSYTKLLGYTDYEKFPEIENPLSSKDSSRKEFRDFMKKSDFFLSERAMDHLYQKGKGKKNIIQAARISGIKIPLWEVVAQQTISHSFSESSLNFLTVSYTNPISNKGINEYRYKLGDTIRVNKRSTVELSFYPKTKKKYDKNKIYGEVLIDLEDAAILEFSAQNLTKNQQSELLVVFQEKDNAWFPKTQNFSLDIGTVSYYDEKDSIAPNGTIILDSIKKSEPMWAKLNTRFFDIESPKKHPKKIFRGYENKVSKTAFSKADSILPFYRDTPISQRDLNTYSAIDSIGKEAKIDRYARLVRVISRDGRLEVGNFDLNLNEILSYNGYEGFRLGLGGGTNYRLNENFDAYGRVAYGFKDAEFKYGLGVNWNVNKPVSGKIFAEYQNDVGPAGRNEWELQSQFLRNQLRGLENFNNTNFIQEKFLRFGYQQDFLKKFTFRLANRIGQMRSRFGYNYGQQGLDQFLDFTSSKVSLMWTPKNQRINTPFGKVTLQQKLPHFHLSAEKFWDITASQNAPIKFNFDVFHDFYSLFGRTKLLVRAGLLSGDAPLFELFEGMGNSRISASGNPRFGVAGNNTFETMQPGQFYSKRFSSFQIRQQFGGFEVFKKKIYPEIIYRALIGDSDYENVDFMVETPDKLYQEVGVEFNGILFNSLGFGAYYRIGEYEQPDFSNNFAVKLTISPTFARD